MDFWDIYSYVAWGVGSLIFIWILADLMRVGQEYDEDFLMSSREGEE